MGKIDDVAYENDDSVKVFDGEGRDVSISSGVVSVARSMKMMVTIFGALLAASSFLLPSIVVRAQGSIVDDDGEYSDDDGGGGGGAGGTIIGRHGRGRVERSMTSAATDDGGDRDAIPSSSSIRSRPGMERAIRDTIKSRRVGGMRRGIPSWRSDGMSFDDSEKDNFGDEGGRHDAPPSSSRGLQADMSLFATDPTTVAATEIPTPVPTDYSSTLYPTHSPSYVCNSDPENCGCLNLFGSDYRGTINTTTSGNACVRWDDPNLNNWWRKNWGENLIQRYPNAGLEGNFCRNPDDDSSGPWCYTGAIVLTEGGWWDYEYCDVPICDDSPTASPSVSTIPTSSAKPLQSIPPSLGPTSTSTRTKSTSSFPSFNPSLSSSPTNKCHVADKSTCGCDDVYQSDYRGTISTTEDGMECARWDADWMWFSEDFSKRAGLDENYCRDPFDYDLAPVSRDRRPGCYTSSTIFDFSYCVVPKCDPCSCMPECGRPNLSQCGCPSALQADECCNRDEGQEKYRQCRCGYLKEACRLNIGNNSTDFCDDAAVECGFCSTYGHNCKCAMYEEICFESPSESTCEVAAASCCAPYSDYYFRVSETCYCDFYTSSKNVLGYESEHELGNCSVARQEISDPIETENSNLEWMYSDSAGGDDWYDNTGWLDDSDTYHCGWFGITCNEDGLVIEINLRNNNLTGPVSSVVYDLFGAFKELKVLDLAENKLTGYTPFNRIPTFLKLEHIDISNNALIGHADMTFPSLTSYANFSHNSFTGVSFKRVNPAYESLKVVDLSNNMISQDASTIFYNIPPSIQELVLSNNSIAGELPNPFPLEKLIRLGMSDNVMEGTLPNFPGTASLIREIDLSNQKQANGGGFTGTIWTDIFKLVDLSVLNLAGNDLTGKIPSSIGNLAKLKVLNLSSNSLVKQIPKELGRLGGGSCI
jgi:Leucine-rich repeat (LRR) protein